MHTSKSQDINIQPGTVIQGKWHHNCYQIIRQLGKGATGVVYLAQSDRQLVAVKISEDSMAITSEVNVLKSLSKVQGPALGPSLLDVDDWVRDNKQSISFYAMEYLKGERTVNFVQKKGESWIFVFLSQLLTDLSELHKAGWVFGDLKPDNLLITGPPPKIRWLDVGGTTILGRAIKEYTEFYDRGYWGLGTRKAEPSYDLFAVAIICIELAKGRQFKKDGRGIKQLDEYINSHRVLAKIRPVLLRALQGKYKHAHEMKEDLMQTFYKQSQEQCENSGEEQHKQILNKPQSRVVKRKFKGLLETAIVTVLLFTVYFLYVYFKMI
ncbi:protein kinase domain-containing protein [Bacillus solimangrovi]